MNEHEHAVKAVMTRCIHFNGIMHDTCKAGVAYKAVKDPNAAPLLLPCWKTDIWAGKRRTVPPCDHREFPSQESAESQVVEHERRIAEFLEKTVRGNFCLTHQIEITKVQIGPCVYAKECGCRLYQGKLDSESAQAGNESEGTRRLGFQ